MDCSRFRLPGRSADIAREEMESSLRTSHDSDLLSQDSPFELETG